MRNVFIILILILTLFFAVLFIDDSEEECNNSYVTFTFDDGYEDTYLEAGTIFKENNVSATVYIITGLVGGYFENYKLMNWNQIEDLKKNGWEIGSHTVNHIDLTMISKEEIDKELKDSKIDLKKFGYEVRTLSIPYGAYNSEIKEISKHYYDATRPSVWGSNYYNDIDRYNLKSYWIVNSTNIDEITSLIDQTEVDNQWIIFMIHHVSYDKNITYVISPEDITFLIDYIKKKDINIKTMSEVLDLGCINK